MKPNESYQPTSPQSNFIPDEALVNSEQLRNPDKILREVQPSMATQRRRGDEFGEDRISPDQPSIEEAKLEKHDAKVLGG